MKANINAKPSISLQYLMIALMPILSLYEFVPLLNIGYFVLLLIVIFKTLRGNLNLKIDVLITMLILMSINLTIGLYKYPDITNTINNTASMIVFTLLMCFICSGLDKEKLYRACKIVGIITTAFLLYQMFEYYIMGNVVSGRLPYLTPIEDRFKAIGYGRPTSFFYEPAHYSIYIAPIYAVSLLKKEYKTSLFLLMGLIFSTSLSGIIMALLTPIIVNIKMFKKLKFNKDLFKKTILLSIGFVLVFLLVRNISYNIFSKISLFALQSTIRVFGTLEYIKYFSGEEIILGVGLNRLTDYFSYKGLVVPNYANSYIFSILCFGLIGALVWICYSLSLYEKLPQENKVLFYIFILVSLSDQLLFNRNLMYLLIWIYVFSTNNQNIIREGEYINE